MIFFEKKIRKCLVYQKLFLNLQSHSIGTAFFEELVEHADVAQLARAADL